MVVKVTSTGEDSLRLGQGKETQSDADRGLLADYEQFAYFVSYYRARLRMSCGV